MQLKCLRTWYSRWSHLRYLHDLNAWHHYPFYVDIKVTRGLRKACLKEHAWSAFRTAGQHGCSAASKMLSMQIFNPRAFLRHLRTQTRIIKGILRTKKKNNLWKNDYAARHETLGTSWLTSRLQKKKNKEEETEVIRLFDSVRVCCVLRIDNMPHEYDVLGRKNSRSVQ